jgi:hypothetical protein
MFGKEQEQDNKKKKKAMNTKTAEKSVFYLHKHRAAPSCPVATSPSIARADATASLRNDPLCRGVCRSFFYYELFRL